MGVLPKGKTRLEQGGGLIPVDSLHFAPDADPTGPARLLTFVMMALHRRGRLRLRQVLAEQRSREQKSVGGRCATVRLQGGALAANRASA